MAIVKKLAAVATALLVLAGPASAFTPTGSVLETDRSNVSTSWQTNVAEYNDSISKACEGFKYARCVREFVTANRDKFPKTFQSEKDFWLKEGAHYKVPLLSGAKKAARQTEGQSGSQPSMVEIMTNFSAKQQEMADELARLSENFGTLAVSNIDGLGEALTEVRQQTQGFAEVQEVVKRLEQAYTDLHNGELTTGMLNAIQSENAADLKPVFADIKALQQADITFNRRLDTVEAEVASINEQLPARVEEAVKETNYWSSLLTWVALVIALCAVGFILWVYRSSKNLTETVVSNQEQLNGENGLQKKFEQLSAHVHDETEKLEQLSALVHDETDGLAATRDLAETALSQNSTLVFQEAPDLKSLNNGATSRWVMTTGDRKDGDLQTYEVRFTKRDDGLYDWSVPRNQDGTGESQPIGYRSPEKMKTKLRQAHLNGRLKYCDVRLRQSDRKQQKTEPEKAPA